VIDLRTDALAPPTDVMWDAMRRARVGWAATGEDENVLALERRGAALLGKDAAVFVPTCSMANLAALLAVTTPGDRVLVDRDAHIVLGEGDWLTHLAGLEIGAPASVVCLENTHTRRGGVLLTLPETRERAAQAPRSHLDGARLPHAAVALGLSLAELAAPVDTVSLSLNKGLCAPMGALLAGDEATIADARIHLKRLGGASIHKAGLFAAAGLVALDLVERLAEDHDRARELARLVAAPEPPTNIVLLDVDATALAGRGVLGLDVQGRTRLVTHRAVADEDVVRAAEAVASLMPPTRTVSSATTPATANASVVPPRETSEPA
jgi:threonine aldolase